MLNFDQPVLIIDDSEIDRYILKRQLRSIGFNNVNEADGPQAALQSIEKAEQRQEAVPRLLILDMHMPTCSGLEFLISIRDKFDSGLLHESKVLMYSATENPNEQTAILQQPMVCGFIVKGAELSVIEETLAAVIEGSVG
ncbi:response regulator [Alteromonas flava]|uniref:response regulator n=1 Tax=Alteromonas flava TaxID=2048003 RepID=UPI0013DC7E51|nr:response regulator [Alteromonas flava]